MESAVANPAARLVVPAKSHFGPPKTIRLHRPADRTPLGFSINAINTNNEQLVTVKGIVPGGIAAGWCTPHCLSKITYIHKELLSSNLAIVTGLVTN